MSLNRSQYNELMRKYDDTQLNNKYEMQKREEEIFERIPKIKELSWKISSGSIDAARKRLMGQREDSHNNALLIAEKEKLLVENGYPKDYLSPIYTCPFCKDTGYIDSVPCKCFRQATINILYEQSNLKKMLEVENFNSFSTKYYSEQNDGIHKFSPKDNIEQVLIHIKSFINNAPSSKENIIFNGSTGVGKTFLTNCIAKELLERGYTVLYLTSNRLFSNVLGDYVMNRDTSDSSKQLYEYVFNCDLLIIDDLGTEYTNSFVSSQLYLCLNERLLKNKSTIISTNLTTKEIVERYSERVFSRVVENYHFYTLYCNDIRYQKRQENLAKNSPRY